MRKNVFLVALSASVIAAPAMAQDTAGNFNGFRIEGLVGYDRMAGDLDEDAEAEADSEVDGDHTEGVLYGAAVGYDFVAGGLLLGAEAEINDSSIGESYEFDDVDFDGTVIDGTLDLDASREFYVGGRFGTLISPKTALYLKGGYAMARLEADANGSIDGETGQIELDADLEGFRIGAGVEHNFGRSTFAKLEYRYTGYGEAEVDYDGEEVDIDEVFDSIDLHRHQLVVGVGYRF